MKRILVFLSIIVAMTVFIGAGYASISYDIPQYNWAQREPSLAPYESCEPVTAIIATKPTVLKIILPDNAPDYNWAQREPSTSPYELCEPNK